MLQSMDWFKGKFTPESPMIFMGKSMVSGEEFPLIKPIQSIFNYQRRFSHVLPIKSREFPCALRQRRIAGHASGACLHVIAGHLDGSDPIVIRHGILAEKGDVGMS